MQTKFPMDNVDNVETFSKRNTERISFGFLFYPPPFPRLSVPQIVDFDYNVHIPEKFLYIQWYTIYVNEELLMDVTDRADALGIFTYPDR